MTFNVIWSQYFVTVAVLLKISFHKVGDKEWQRHVSQQDLSSGLSHISLITLDGIQHHIRPTQSTCRLCMTKASPPLHQRTCLIKSNYLCKEKFKVCSKLMKGHSNLHLHYSKFVLPFTAAWNHLLLLCKFPVRQTLVWPILMTNPDERDSYLCWQSISSLHQL